LRTIAVAAVVVVVVGGCGYCAKGVRAVEDGGEYGVYPFDIGGIILAELN
jgi:hypothetical protein